MKTYLTFALSIALLTTTAVASDMTKIQPAERSKEISVDHPLFPAGGGLFKTENKMFYGQGSMETKYLVNVANGLAEPTNRPNVVANIYTCQPSTNISAQEYMNELRNLPATEANETMAMGIKRDIDIPLHLVRSAYVDGAITCYYKADRGKNPPEISIKKGPNSGTATILPVPERECQVYKGRAHSFSCVGNDNSTAAPISPDEYSISKVTYFKITRIDSASYSCSAWGTFVAADETAMKIIKGAKGTPASMPNNAHAMTFKDGKVNCTYVNPIVGGNDVSYGPKQIPVISEQKGCTSGPHGYTLLCPTKVCTYEGYDFDPKAKCTPVEL